MTYYPDLEPCGYFGGDYGRRLLCVGWLERGETVPSGDAPPEFTSALKCLLVNPWQPFVFMGAHSCSFCKLSGGPSTFTGIGGDQIVLGQNNLFIPGDGLLYVAPSTIIHYIDSHDYCPPNEFVDAVLRCPTMRSMAYLKAIQKNAFPGLLKRFPTSEMRTLPINE